MTQSAHRDLPRVLGLFSIVGIVIGSVIGSGIFIVPATVAAAVKSPLLMMAVWVAGGLLSLFGALAFAELGAAYPHAGGMYVYLREAYGPLTAFLFGWTLFLVIDSGSIATLAVAFASKYLTYFIPLSPAAQKLAAIGLVVFLVVVNYLGVRWGALLQNLLMVVKFGAILAVSLCVFIFADGTPSHWTAPAEGGLPSNLAAGFGAALVAVLWAYKGWEMATYTAGEFRDPEKNIPRGFLLGTALVVLLYLAANLAYLYVLPASAIAQSTRIASDAMNAAVGPAGAAVIAFVILFSITGAANGNVLTAPRVLFAMSRDGLFFKRLGDVHPRFLTPHNAILAIGLWSAVLCTSGSFEQLFTYVIFGQWIFFGLTILAVVILRRKKPDLPRPYRAWGYPVTPALFILGALFVSASTLASQPLNALAGLGIIFLGFPVYWLCIRGKRPSPEA